MELIGLPVEEARRRLGEACVREVVTRPPRGEVRGGEARVVCVRERDGVVELVVAEFVRLKDQTG